MSASLLPLANGAVAPLDDVPRLGLEAFRQEVLRMWLDQLRRRSQRSRWNWERFMERLGHLLPEIRVLHPYPPVRFDAKYPR